MKREYNGEIIDEYSQTILWILRDSNQPLPVADLIDNISLESKQKLRYRMQKLDSVDLVYVAETDRNLNIADTKYYDISEEGLDWLFENQDDVEHAVGRKRYLESVDRLRERIDDVDTRQKRLNNRTERHKESVNSMLEDHAEALEDKEKQISLMFDRTNNMQEDISNLKSDMSKTKKDIKSLKNAVDRIDEQIQDLKSSQEKQEDQIQTHHSQIEKIRRAIESLQQDIDGLSVTSLFRS